MTAVYHGRGEKMEGYELYRLSDEEIQHVGVKGMKWGKRKSRSAYMTAVDKHEAKTKANRQKVADHKAREKEQGKAVAKAVGKKYMGAVAKHEANSQARKDKVAAHKAREKEHAKEDWASLANRSKEVEAASQAKRDAKKAASKAKYEQEKSEFNQVKDKIAVKKLNKARAKELSKKLSKGLDIAVAVNDVYGDISPTGLKNHFANAEQLEKYGIEYNP